MNLESVQFRKCELKESDFTEMSAINTSFEFCDLLNCQFEQSNLSGADFTSAVNYRINPLKNQIKKARFSASGLIGLVADFGIEVVPD